MSIKVVVFLMFSILSSGCIRNNKDTNEKDLCEANFKFLIDRQTYISANLKRETNQVTYDDSSKNYNSLKKLDELLNYLNDFEQNLIQEVTGMTEIESYKRIKLVLFNNDPTSQLNDKFSAYDLKQNLMSLKNILSKKLGVFINISDLNQQGVVVPWEVGVFFGASFNNTILNIQLIRNKIFLIKKSILVEE